ncbi:HEPN domain-containing protein [Pseudomonas putida]|uniref:Uncharacterized protein n=1 Tax=Pseudomonas putida TaxID=303 RepID=A0A6S5TVI4_PSEPU|nr:HEPN domain-containing protein [Pseudomonas putida]BBT40714.1 hypothetical protein WP8W18C01_30550 [Pseudomonas putida]
MKTEFLILMPDDEAFCNSKKSFVDFLKIDSLLSVTGSKISYRKSPKSRDLVTAKFRVDTDKVKSNSERYFLLVLECDQTDQVDDFSELSDRVRTIAERISPGSTAVNTLWDGVGRIYAEKSYPIINEVENLMRRLIAKFMLLTVGMNWSKDAINAELHKKIEKFEDEDPYISDLHKLDFIHLSQVLFEKKRDITLEELDRILQKTDFDADDREKILKYIPKSNWEKYFAALVDDGDQSLERKWELLYKLRNKVAHNRNVKKKEYEQIRGLSNKIKEIIGKATAKLGEIDINEEDRELIIYSYRSESASTIVYLSEISVAEFYSRSGYEVSPLGEQGQPQYCDFIATKDGRSVAVVVKVTRRSRFLPICILALNREQEHRAKIKDHRTSLKTHIAIVLQGDESEYPNEKILRRIKTLTTTTDDSIEVVPGILGDNNEFIPIAPLETA